MNPPGRTQRVVLATLLFLLISTSLEAHPCDLTVRDELAWSTTTGCFDVPEDRGGESSKLLPIYYELSVPNEEPLGAVLLFHGGPGYPRRHMNQYGSMWEGIRTHYIVLYFHQRGSGYSALIEEEADLVGKEAFYSLDTIVEDAHTLAAALVPDARWILLGKSAGGFLALKYALRFPDDVASLILACTTAQDEYLASREQVKWEFYRALERRHGGFLAHWNRVKRFAGVPKGRFKMFARISSEPMGDLLEGIALDLSYTLDGQFQLVALAQDAAQGRYDLLMERISGGNVTLVRTGLESIPILNFVTCRELGFGRSNPTACEGIEEEGRYDLRPRLREIDAPTLVLSGQYDPILPPRFQREIADGIGDNAELVVFELSGHMIFLEQPQGTAEVVLEFLKIPHQQPQQAPGL